MTRVLFVGDMAWTGFGTVTMDLGRALLDRGEDVRFISLNESGDDVPPEPFGSRTALIGTASGWLGLEDPALTSQRLEGMFTGSLFEDGWTPEAAILLGDPASLFLSPVLGFLPDGFPAFHYVPIEGIAIPPRWGELWTNTKPVALCEFGAEQIEHITGTRPPVVYHGVDTSVFHAPSASRPLTLRTDRELIIARSRAEARKALGWPADEIILFRADRLMPRKMYGSLLRAVAPVIAKHQKVRLVLHMASFDQGGDFRDLRSHFPPFVQERMNLTDFHDRYGSVQREVLALMYAASDLYVGTGAEGWGLCYAESLACGTPALGIRYSAVPEVIGPAGETVPVGALVDNVYGYYWARPNEAAFTEALERLISDIGHLRVLGTKGPYHVEQFTWARAAEQFGTMIAAALPQEVAA